MEVNNQNPPINNPQPSATSTEELVQELKKLNQKLSQISNGDRYFLYSSRPLKFVLLNFVSGISHSLGTLFGTFIIAAALVYLFRTMDITKPVTLWIESVMSQIRWEQIIPMPKGY